jgi:hypothetical protein
LLEQQGGSGADAGAAQSAAKRTLQTPAGSHGIMALRTPAEGEVTLELRYDPDQRLYRYQLRSHLFGVTDQIMSSRLQRPPEQSVEDFVANLNELARNRRNYTADETRRWLKGKGSDLWAELIPKDLERLFWEHRSRITRMTILSAGDPIPWEVMYPLSDDGEDAGFLAEQFPVARWLFGPAPAARLHMSDSFFVLPEGSPPTAKQEVDALKNAVYQRNRAAIQSRIWDAITTHAQGYGTPDRPISVLAHSLGGVITFDAAIDAQRPLWIKTLVTFGSQPAFFHVLDPRQELSRYVRNSPVKLPATIGSWVNLWEAMDFLAFATGKVFLLHSLLAASHARCQSAASHSSTSSGCVR